MRRSFISRSFLAAGLVGAACRPADRPAAAGTPAPRAEIIVPAEGATLVGPVTVRLRAEGVTIVPADGQRTPGRGHHHVFVDTDPAPNGTVIPKTEYVFHLGDGSEELTLPALAPGSHRLIAVIADGAHIPLEGVARDTVTITVAGTPDSAAATP